MSYARLSEDSDVYVFAHVNGGIRCCWCRFGEDFRGGPAEMLEHLRAHAGAGDKVPAHALERLEAEMRALPASSRNL